ncbi:hypothetical protein NDS46_05220 [Paenibacillus thiaminolyticus]|nr:hypothetical protein [Paenibacillus thiaminolyticus]WCF09302.1 hypothetical protein NDS46_05220 [Paenibacillus thiaminolyticus]
MSNGYIRLHRNNGPQGETIGKPMLQDALSSLLIMNGNAKGTR